jgi:hypothetical protein
MPIIVESSPAGPAPSPAAKQITRTRAVIFFLVFLAGMIGAGELLTRVGFSAANGFSPYYLTYGFVPDIEWHSDVRDGYMKFPPNSRRRTKITGDSVISISINADGFRGRAAWKRPKPPGVFRVVTLGESSTFGLTNPDDETYPALLETHLAERMGGRKVEVLNMGIPHYRTNHIVAAARAELPALQPDVVTLYAGYNNAYVARSGNQTGRIYRLKDWFKFHSVAYRALHPYVVTAYTRVSGLLRRDLVGLPHMGLPLQLSADQVRDLRATARVEFATDLDSLLAIIDRTGAATVLVTQSFTISRLPSFRIIGSERPYEEEVFFVDSLLRADGKVLAPWSTLLTHRDLMEIVRERARSQGRTLVDGIKVLDEDRLDVMASMVHLTTLGNTRLSRAIASQMDSAGMLRSERPAGR